MSCTPSSRGRTPRIYLAGGSPERLTVVRPLIRAVERYGYQVTYDWTAAEGWEQQPTATRDTEAAELDLNGVLQADVLWYVAPADKSEGSATELGAALALRKLVVVSGPRALELRRIFPRLADCIFPEHAQALDYLANRAWAIYSD